MPDNRQLDSKNGMLINFGICWLTFGHWCEESRLIAAFKYPLFKPLLMQGVCLDFSML
jgi:hypothetical protein